MSVLLTTTIAFAISFIASAAIHPALVLMARRTNILDNPNSRKLQAVPVPVLGGIGVFFGIIIGTLCTCPWIDCSSLYVVIGCMMVMMYVGALDDVLDISPLLRLFAQVATVLVLIYVGGYALDDFHGLWGIGALPEAVSVPLTIFATVGIINALNLIDGVDGLLSTFTIVACAIFGILFYSVGDLQLFILAVVTIGALIPFLLHNAFGKKSKMFVGDGGTLLIGVMLSVFVMEVIGNPAYGRILSCHNIGVVPFVLALLAIPVFDTLRVMTARIVRGTSPLIGDKTHLHHLFVWLNVSHVGTTSLVVTLNLLVVASCLVAAHAGMSVNMQFAVVVAASLLVTCGVYYGVRLLYRLYPEGTEHFRTWKAAHKPNRRMFEVLKRVVDRF